MTSAGLRHDLKKLAAAVFAFWKDKTMTVPTAELSQQSRYVIVEYLYYAMHRVRSPFVRFLNHTIGVVKVC